MRAVYAKSYIYRRTSWTTSVAEGQTNNMGDTSTIFPSVKLTLPSFSHTVTFDNNEPGRANSNFWKSNFEKITRGFRETGWNCSLLCYRRSVCCLSSVVCNVIRAGWNFRVLATVSSVASDDRTGRTGTAVWIRLLKYAGVKEDIVLNVGDAILHVTPSMLDWQPVERQYLPIAVV